MKATKLLITILIIMLPGAHLNLVKAQRSIDAVRTDMEVLKLETMFIIDSLKFEAQKHLSEAQLKYSSQIESIQMEANSKITILKHEFRSGINDISEKTIICPISARKHEREMSTLESEFELKLEEVSICCSTTIDKLEMEYEHIAADIENNFRMLIGRAEMEYNIKQKKLESELKTI